MLIVGGTGSPPHPVALSTAELYDPISATFTPTTGSLVVTHSGHTATLLQSGKVLITGGKSLGFAELYDPVTDSFSLTGNPVVLDGAPASAALLPDGSVLLVPNSDPAERYDPAAGTFSPVVSNLCCLPLRPPVVVPLAGGDALIMGSTTELYSFAPNRIAATTQPNVSGLTEVAATILNDGAILKSGGVVGLDGGVMAYTEIFDSKTRSFGFTGSMIAPHANHILTTLKDGRVLSAGGAPEFWQ